MVLVPEILAFLLLTFDLLLHLLFLMLQPLPLLHQPDILLPLPLDLPLVLLQLLLLPDQFLPLPVKLLPLALGIGDVVIAVPDGLHVLLDHAADALGLLRLVLLQPAADHVEELLHLNTITIL